MPQGKRVTFQISQDVAADLETLSRLVGIRHQKGPLVSLLLERGLRAYAVAIKSYRNGDRQPPLEAERLGVAGELEMARDDPLCGP